LWVHLNFEEYRKVIAFREEGRGNREQKKSVFANMIPFPKSNATVEKI